MEKEITCPNYIEKISNTKQFIPSKRPRVSTSKHKGVLDLVLHTTENIRIARQIEVIKLQLISSLHCYILVLCRT